MPLTLQSFATTGDALPALGGDGAHYLGGGTLLLRRTNAGDAGVATLVRSTDPALALIEIAAGVVRLGAAVTMARIAANPDLGFLAGAARSVGGPAIRNMATVGGNLHAPAPYGDLAVALLALGASVTVRGIGGETSVPLESWRVGAGAIVTGVRFPLPAQGSFRYLKVSRVKPKGLSVVTIAAVIEEKAGLVAKARIALGCLSPTPMRAPAAEAALFGRPLDQKSIAAALAVALDGTAPITDAIASAWYRAAVLPVHLGRLLAGPSQGH